MWMKDSFYDLDSAQTRAFYDTHNSAADTYIDAAPDRQYFTHAFESLTDHDVRGVPYVYGGRSFWLERRATWQKVSLVCDGEKLIDFDTRLDSLDYWFVSPDGNKIVYGTSRDGNEQTTLHIFDVARRKDLAEHIPFAGYTDQGSICWLSDSRSFIYPRMNGYAKTGPADKWLLGTKLYLHRLGDDPAQDRCVFGEGMPEAVMLVPTLATTDKTLYVAVTDDELTHDVWRVPLDEGSRAKKVTTRKASFQLRTAYGKLYALTNDKAPQYRLLAVDEADASETPVETWDEILPESDDILQDFWLHPSRAIVAQYSHNISHELRVYDLYGNQTGSLPLLDTFCSVAAVSCRTDQPDMYVSVSGFTTPPSILRYASLRKSAEYMWQREALAGDDKIIAKQCFATSADRTQVPYFYLRSGAETANVPTLLYGYGGFNIALEPSYVTTFRPWIMAGGAVVIANLRGGSEFGENWHAAGAMQHKQNTFDDCIAIAETLIAESTASTDQIGVLGGSNGGLLVAAVTVQRPDLFRAGAALVPLTDMLEFHKYQVAEFWVHEYGDPRIPEQRRWIRQWSPYSYPIHADIAYPALYYETALNDARVHPFHAFKMVARLETEAASWKGPLLLRTHTDAGHDGSNVSKDEQAARSAEPWIFLATELGLVPSV